MKSVLKHWRIVVILAMAVVLMVVAGALLSPGSETETSIPLQQEQYGGASKSVAPQRSLAIEEQQAVEAPAESRSDTVLAVVDGVLDRLDRVVQLVIAVMAALATYYQVKSTVAKNRSGG